MKHEVPEHEVNTDACNIVIKIYFNQRMAENAEDSRQNLSLMQPSILLENVFSGVNFRFFGRDWPSIHIVDWKI